MQKFLHKEEIDSMGGSHQEGRGKEVQKNTDCTCFVSIIRRGNTEKKMIFYLSIYFK
jgi:hypothetical protein